MKNIIGAILACLILHSVTFAGNFTWTGTTNSDWNTSTNWSPNGLPGASDSIIINSTTNSLTLTANKSIKRLMMYSGVLDLGGDTITITGTSGLNGGSINNGLFKTQTSGLINFNGTTFGAEVSAQGQIKLSGCVFNNTAYFEHNSSASGTGLGGNTFNGVSTFKNAGTTTFRLAGSNPDTFNNDVYFSNVATSGSSTFHISYGATSYFNGNVEVSSTSSFGVSFSPAGTGSSILASGKTITIGSAGFVGTLVVQNFTQSGTTAQSLTLAGVLNISNSTLNGAFTSSSANLLLSGSNFYGQSSFTKTGSSSDYSYGNNHFYSDATFNNNSTTSAILRLASTAGDTYDGNVALNTSTGYIQGAYTDTSDFKGNISINNAKVTFNNNWGSVRFNGSNSQVISGSADYLISKLLINKTSGNVTFQNSVTIDSLLNLHAGVLVFDATKSITLKAITQVTEMSSLSYIDGLVKKIGNTAFTFPVGDSNEYRPVSISAPSNSTDAFVAQYFKQQQTQGSSLDTGVNYISTCNYWNVDRVTGSSNVSLGFQWFDNTCDVFDVDSIRLMNFNSGSWKNRGQMTYTGNDSAGTLSSNGSIQNFGNFTYGHNLFPNLSFEVSLDSTNDPVIVNFIISSRGIPNEQQYQLDFNRGQGFQTDSIIENGKRKLTAEYALGGKYFPSLSIPQNASILTFEYALDLSGVIALDFGFNITTPHPIIFPLNGVAACYDIMDFSVDVSGLALGDICTITASNNLKFDQAVTTPTTGTANTTIDPLGSFITIEGTSPLFNGILVFDAEFICNLVNTTSTLNEDITVSCTNSNFGISITTPSSIYLDLNTSTNVISFELIESPEFVISGTNLQTHDKEYYAMGDVFTREYEVKVVEGISNAFRYDIDLEEDLELIKLEVVDNLGNNNISLFVSNCMPPNYCFPCTTCYQGGSINTLKFNFLAGALLVNSVLPLAPADLSNLEVKVDLADCISKSSLNSGGWTFGLYDNGDVPQANSLLIRETLRVKKIMNCSTVTSSVTNSAVHPICDNVCSFSVPPYSSDFDIQTEKIDPLFGISYVEKTATGYIPLVSQSISACTVNPIDFGIAIKNNAIFGVKKAESAVGIIKEIKIGINSQVFEYDRIFIGGFEVPPNLISYSSANGIDYISINISQCNITSSVVDVSGDGLNDGISAYYPDPNEIPLKRMYRFLYGGKTMNIVFTDLSIKDCFTPNWPLKEPNHPYFYFIHDVEITCIDLCDYINNNFDDVNPHQDDKPWLLKVQLHNRFSGNTTSSGKPLDVGTVSGTSLLTFQFDETTLYTAAEKLQNLQIDPWVIEPNTPIGYYDLVNCPDFKYYFHFEMPYFLNAMGSPVYKIFNVAFFDLNGVQIGSTITPQVATSGYYDFEVVGCSIPDFKVKINLDINCDVGFGLSDFKGEYRSYCNKLGCTDCNFAAYGASTVTLFRHCHGDCPGRYVSTSEFTLERKTLGWTSEQQFLNQVLPDVSPSNVATNRVYPCDVVKVESNNGLAQTSQYVGISNLSELFFDVLIDETQFPLAPPAINLFSALSTAFGPSGFTIEAKDASGVICTLYVPLNWATDVSFLQNNSWRPDHHIIRFKLNKNYSDLNNCPYSALTLLQNYQCKLDFVAYCVVENLQVLPNFYEMRTIFGEYVYQAGSNTNIEACDPYVQDLIYLQSNPKRHREMFTGPYGNKLTSTSQCELLYDLHIQNEGGYPQGDDFPNEFRPLFYFPNIIDVKHLDDLEVTEAAYVNPYSTTVLFPYNVGLPTGSPLATTPIQLQNSLQGFAIDKAPYTDRSFHLKLWRNCPKTDAITGVPYLDIEDELLSKGIWPYGCNLDADLFDEFYDVTISGGDKFDEDNLKFTWGITSTQTFFYPVSIPFQLAYFASHQSNVCQNVWVYFKLNNSSPPNADFEVYDGTTKLFAQQATFLTGSPWVYFIDDIKMNSPENLRVVVKWNSCPSSEPFLIEAVYGAYCDINGFPSDINNIPPLPGDIITNSCIQLHSEVLEITPPTGDLDVTSTVESTSSDGIENCETFKFKYEINNDQGDLSSISLDLILPNAPLCSSCTFSIINCSAEVNGTTVPLSIPPNPTIGLSTTTYTWDVLNTLLQEFNINPPHFNRETKVAPNPISNPITFEFELQLQSSTPSPISASSFPFNINTNYNNTCSPTATPTTLPETINVLYEGTPMLPTSIVQTGEYCGAGSSINLEVPPPAIGSFTYLWSTGALVNSITVNSPGVYSVIVTNPSAISCQAVTIYHVVDDHTILLDFVASPLGYCSGGTVTPIITITNNDDPGIGSSNQSLYSYSWSLSGVSLGNAHPFINTPASSPYVYDVVVTHGGCTANASVVIPDNTPQFTVAPVSYCEATDPNPFLEVVFTGNPPPLGSIITYNWNSTSTNSPTYNVTAPPDGGTNNFQVTVTVNGCSATSPLIPVTNLTPTAVINYQNHIEGYCYGSDVNLIASTNIAGFSYSWTANGVAQGSLNSTLIDISTFGINSPSSIAVTLVVDNNGCSSSTTSTMNNITPTVLINPPYSHYNLCPGDNANLISIVTPISFNQGNILYDYLWSDGQTTQSNLVSPTGNPQQWVYTVTVTNQLYNECTAQSSFQIINMNPNVKFSPPLISIPPGGSASLNPIITNLNPGYSTYYWTYTASSLPLPCPACTTQTVNPSANTTYTLDFVASDPFGISPACSSSASVTVAISGNTTCPLPGYTELTQNILSDPNGPYTNWSTGLVSLPAGSKWFVKSQLYISGLNLDVGQDAEILFTKNSGLTIASNNFLSIVEGAILRACGDDMWDGIYMQPRSSLFLHGMVGHPVLIEDAEIGVFAAGSLINIHCWENVTFNQNNIAVHLENGDFSSAIFNGTEFTCDAQLINPHAAAVYSYRHIELFGAGTVNFNTGGVNFSNIFENAYTGIFSRNTNLNVESCEFTNVLMSSPPNYFGIGIDFRGNTNLLTTPTLNVGLNNSGKIPNDFQFHDMAISSTFRATVNIIDNVITNANKGIRARTNSNYPSNLTGSVYIDGNNLNNIQSSGIILANNQNVITEIFDNDINSSMANTQLNPLLETIRGIYVHNATTTSDPVELSLIHWNRIINCKHGIQVMNQNGSYIQNNQIDFFVGDNDIRNSTSIFRRGIVLQGCENLNLINNTIFRPLGTVGTTTYNLDVDMVDISTVPNQVVSLCGFHVGKSQNCVFTDNIIHQLPTGFHLYSDNTSNQFNCNHLYRGIEGFKLRNVFMNSQGNSTYACGNEWASWPTGQLEFTRIMGTGSNIQPFIDWNFLSGVPEHNPTSGVTYSPPSPSFMTLWPIANSNCDLQPCFDCEVERIAELIRLADSALIDDALKFAIENYVYSNLKDSLQLMYSGSIWDASIQNFFTTRSLSNVGLLENVEELLSDDEFASSYLLNGEIEVSNLVEENLYEVNRICSEYGNEFDSLSTTDIEILETIAYQYPEIGSTAVYRARAILGIDLDDSQVQYRLLGIDSNNIKNGILVYPNPVSESLNIVFSKEFTDVSTTIQLFDLVGSLVMTKSLSEVIGLVNVNVTNIQDGVYLIKVIQNGSCVFSDKLIKLSSIELK